MAKKKNIIYAKDCQCCICGRQAVALFPVTDPDIPSYPYCRECLDKTKMELLIKLQEIDKKYENNQKTKSKARK